MTRKPVSPKPRAKSRKDHRLAHTPHRARAVGKETEGIVDLYGLHAVRAALTNPARTGLYLSATRNALNELRPLAEARGIFAAEAEPDAISAALPAGAVHQGVHLRAEALAVPDLEEACAEARLVLLLDQVTDPHNVGAILRSAAAFGAAAVIMTQRHSPALDGVVAKAASGALEQVAVPLVPNLARAIEELQALGFEVLGLEGTAEISLPELDVPARTALALGAEGPGLRRLTRERCDRLVRLPTTGRFASLNVSNAAAVSLYELSRSSLLEAPSPDTPSGKVSSGTGT